MTFRAGAALVLGATLSSCIYNFDNPVAQQSSGTVSGQVVVGAAAAGQSLGGATIDLLWSNLSITLGATSGYFNFLALPAGTYRLTISVPPPSGSPNDLPIELSQGQIYLPQTPSGAPDTLALGSITVDLAGVVGGTISGLGDGGAVIGAFEPDPPDGGVGEYEGYSETTDSTGAFALTLPAGTHQLWASTAGASGTLVAQVQAGQSVQGQQLTLSVPAGGPSADLVGYAVVGNYGADATVAELQTALQDAGLSLELSPPGGVPLPDFAFETPDPAAGVTALRVEQQLLPGTLYKVSVGPPASLGTHQIVPAVLENVPAIAGRTTFLQQIFLFSVPTFDANEAPQGPSADAGTLLLVDNDGNTAPSGNADPSLTLFQDWLGASVTTYQEPSDQSDLTDVDNANPTLAGIGTIVFFTGALENDTVSPAQQTSLQNWLNEGSHTLILFSPGLVYDTGVNSWGSSETNAFLTQVLGAAEDQDDPDIVTAPMTDTPVDETASTIVTGSSAVLAFANEQWTVTSGISTVNYLFSVIDPVPGVDVLATVSADPGASATANAPAPVVLGRKNIGTAGTSTVVWVGFTVEDIQANLTGFNDLNDFFAAVQNYAALP